MFVWLKIAFLIICVVTSSLYAEQRPVVIVAGTRPEAIKLCPLYLQLRQDEVPTFFCATGQHDELLHEVLDIFGVKPDVDFKIMKKDQDLCYLTCAVLEKTTALLRELNPALVVVQGDTVSALGAALAAFYLKIPVAHVEAGLRSHNISRPFPEEMNRRSISLLASYHFAPTQLAADQLKKEGVAQDHIYCVGNTVVDALYLMQDRLASGACSPSAALATLIKNEQARGQRLFLLTAHRRESFGEGLQSIFQGIRQALIDNPTLTVIYPIHPNPQIKEALLKSGLEGHERLHITPPLPYPDLVHVLSVVDGVATDSGGIQEEAASLNKPTLVLRTETDRPEALGVASTHLVGTQSAVICTDIGRIIQEKQALVSTRASSPYGDGQASERISKIIKQLIETP